MLRALAFVTALAIFTAIGPGTGMAESGPNASGQPVPRFVSLNSGEVNIRSGPGVRYPIQWIYQRRNMPLEVIAEYDTWRKIRDWEGTEGWVHRAMLSGKRSVMVIAAETTLRLEPDAASPAVARLMSGVVGLVDLCRKGWCRIETHDLTGWLPRNETWGLFADEPIE